MRPIAEKTLTDYVVIAISPALIVTLIGSFVFFLLTALYAGPYEWRLKWCFGAFILGAVGVARISIEDGRERAVLFAAPLALATLLAVSKFVSFPLLTNLGIIAIIWYSADKLTWDCTVIDEEEDASGEGLLAHMNMDGPVEGDTSRAREQAVGETGEDGDRSLTREPRAGTRWSRFVESRRKRHVPGLWVIYLSLIALPAFGLLHAMVADDDARRQGVVFKYLLVYVASGLALLMTTSFLGLRRYLRQRQLDMPVEMAGVWLGVGAVLIVSLMLFSALLPRPAADKNLLTLAWRLTSPDDHEPSKMAQGKDGVDKPGSDSDTDKGGKQNPQGEAKTGESDQPGGEKPSDQGKTDGEKSASSKDGQQPQATPEPSGSFLASLGDWLGTLLRWLLLLGVIAAGIYWAWKNWDRVVAAWRKFLQELRDFWDKLLSRTRPEPDLARAAAEASPLLKPFALYENPFATGLSQRLSPEELVKHTFHALEAWAADRGHPRQGPQTPHEFARALAQAEPSIAAEAAATAELYTRLAYSRGSLPASAQQHLERLWQKLTEAPVLSA